MFETICYEHWELGIWRRAPSIFNLYYCTRNDCAWCSLPQVLFNFDTRFLRNVRRHIEKLKLQKLTRVRRLFLITE
jgi:hypothetical protein